MELSKSEYTKFVGDVADAVVRRLLRRKNLLRKEAEEEWLTSREAAAYLHIPLTYLYQILDKLPHSKLGNSKNSSLRFPKSGLMEYVSSSSKM